MNPLNLQVAYLDGTEASADVIAIDMIAFESKFDLSMARLDKDMKLTHLFWLAWQSLYRQKQTALDFEEWAATVAGVGEGDSKK